MPPETSSAHRGGDAAVKKLLEQMAQAQLQLSVLSPFKLAQLQLLATGSSMNLPAQQQQHYTAATLAVTGSMALTEALQPLADQVSAFPASVV